MIGNPILRSAFWIIGVIVFSGYLFVIIWTLKLLRTTKLTHTLYCQHTIIANISIADFIMSFYLLTIVVYSVVYSDRYEEIDLEWRSSLKCSVIGSLAVISSEASCFLMVTLTAFRLRNISNPIASVTMPTRPWKFCIAVSWLVAILLGTVPYLNQNSQYFVHEILFRSIFNKKGIWRKPTLSEFACFYSALTNQTEITTQGTTWKTTQQILRNNFSESMPLKKFGYYGETSICMPRLFVQKDDAAWEYTLTLITLNFLAFVFILVSYVMMYVKWTKKTNMLGLSNQSTAKQESIMQKRIARIIATDFCCWIPISIMSYMRVSGVVFSNIVYQISAVFLLPINSAINPILYSALPDRLVGMFACKK